MPDPMRTVSFKLPRHLDNALNDVARRRGTSRSALAREALEILVQGDRQSVTAMVDVLIGGVQDRRDLSSNPKHMTPYGK